MYVEEDVLRSDLKKFWLIENVDDDSVIDRFKADISFDGHRYVTKLPFRPSHGELADNFSLSKKRLDCLKPKIAKQGIFAKYDKVFKDYEASGIIEKVPQNEEAKV